ncbi:hypothetical protein [Nakamurella antarctica]|uniref:hypothetical protein n=1 Tax=Nakamurella antarctica TaxID=1902245 RepID=UPI0019D1F960|nr:hypothetical protein [Nakamurella antarctica]
MTVVVVVTVVVVGGASEVTGTGTGAGTGTCSVEGSAVLAPVSALALNAGAVTRVAEAGLGALAALLDALVSADSDPSDGDATWVLAAHAETAAAASAAETTRDISGISLLRTCMFARMPANTVRASQADRRGTAEIEPRGRRQPGFVGFHA